MNKPDTEPTSYAVLDHNPSIPYWSANSARHAQEEAYRVPQVSYDANQSLQVPWQPPQQYPSSLRLINEHGVVPTSHWDVPTQLIQQKNMTPEASDRIVRNEDRTQAHTQSVREDIVKYAEFIGLDLSGQAINNLSKEVFDYTFLTILKLDGNNLLSLPKEINLLKNLVTLDISRNKLQSIPAEIGEMMSLRELLISKNQLRTLPHELGQLYMLNSLVLDDNPFDEPLMSIFCDGGAPAVMHYLCEMCPVGPPPPDREWLSSTDYRSVDSAGFMSYNILCNSYASKLHYGYVPSWALSWEYRRDLIIREILTYMADIICLQEVEFDKYENFFQTQLSSMGNYKGFFWPKTRARTMNEYERSQVDGCATFWKMSAFRSLAGHCIELQQASLQDATLRKSMNVISRLTSRDNIAVVTLLEHIDTGIKVLVVNAHLHWDPTLTDVKLVQMYLLTNEIQRLLISWGCCYSPADIKRFPVILAGDFNSTPESSVFQYIESGITPKDHPDLEEFSYRSPLLESFKHQFNLKSAYSHTGELDFTNFTPCFKGVIDYIWYSPMSLIPLGVLGGIDPSYTKMTIGFPSAHNPSDHILILSSFAFTKKLQYK